MRNCLEFFVLFFLVNTVLCGDIDISHSPSSIRFGSGPDLRLSDFDDLFATSLGYSTGKSLLWKGLTVVSPFDYPSAVILFDVSSGGANVRREGVRYLTKDDISLNEVFKSLTSTVSNQAQRPVHFENAHVSDLIDENIRPISLSFEHLHADVQPDATFLHEMSFLPSVAERISEVSSHSHGGQDIVFISIDSFASVVKHYGEDSPQVREASDILRTALSQAEDRFRKIYDDKVVITSTMIDQQAEQKRFRRSLANEILEGRQSRVTEEQVNIAFEYREDFPVMFNIILFLSIVLIMALIAVSVEMATMDPGRDSIIYRMTNPRMKKDQ